MHPTRVSLLEKMRDGTCELAWQDFYQMYATVILRYAQKLGLSEVEAHDVLQETMMTLIRKLPEFEYDPRKGRFRNWLLTIVHRKTLSALRRAYRKREHSYDEPRGDGACPESRQIADPSVPEPGAHEEQAWQASIFEEALAGVRADPSIQAGTYAVFVAYVIEEKPCGDVARQFGITENAVYQIKNRIIKRLRKDVAARLEAAGARQEVPV